MWTTHDYDEIPGTYVFNGRRAATSYALNRMCMSFNDAANRTSFLGNEDAYCAAYGVTEAQRQAVRDRDILRLVQLGGNIYYLAKLAGIFGLTVQDVGAQQTGVTADQFRQRLVAAAEQ
jgi:protocatechuate 4,5-dioxygenase alpha chain